MIGSQVRSRCNCADVGAVMWKRCISRQDSTYVAHHNGDSDEARVVRPPLTATCAGRIAFTPRAGQ